MSLDFNLCIKSHIIHTETEWKKEKLIMFQSVLFLFYFSTMTSHTFYPFIATLHVPECSLNKLVHDTFLNSVTAPVSQLFKNFFFYFYWTQNTQTFGYNRPDGEKKWIGKRNSDGIPIEKDMGGKNKIQFFKI